MAEIEYIEIDPVSRKILSPSDMLLGVMEDRNVERKYFKCPKIVGDNIDLSTHTIGIKIIQSLNKEGTSFEKRDPVIYYCQDVSDEEDYITFSWKLGPEVCEKDGYVAFSIVALDGDVTRWNTYPAVGKVLITIPGGIETGTDDSGTSVSLQEKSVTPSESAQTVTPDSGYDGLSSVTVDAISDTYVGSGVTKKSAATYTPGTSDQTIASGQYLNGAQTIKGDSNLIAGNIKNGVSIFGVAGSYEGSSEGTSGGLKVKTGSKTTGSSGTINSVTIDTGLTNCHAIMAIAGSSTNTTWAWFKSIDKDYILQVVYKSSYTSTPANVDKVDIDGGTVTLNKYSDDYPLGNGVTINWVAYGE